MIHLLFEQSGTFKKEFQKLGHKAEDYDILNDFGETDHQLDLFLEINKGYEREREHFRLFQGGRVSDGILSLC